MEPPLLEIRGATKVYGGGLFDRGEQLAALQDVSLTIAESPVTITAIAGESGSGKTTLANAAARLRRADRRADPLSRRGHRRTCRGPAARRTGGRSRPIFQDPYEVYNPFYRVEHVFDIAGQELQAWRAASARSTAH